MIYIALIPLIMAMARTDTPRLGAQWYGRIDDRYVMAGRQWVKLEARWDWIEAVRGVYEWPDELDVNAEYLWESGTPLLLMFHNSPAWSRCEPYNCRLPDSEHWFEFARFILAAIDRYHPQAVEIWNEPEAGVSDGILNWCCGCVVDPLAYTRLLEYIYPLVKQAHPDVIILGGALTQQDTAWSRAFLASKPRMDALSWHYYSWAYAGQATVTGDALVTRRNQLAQAGYPLWLTETSHVCALPDCGDAFRLMQDYWLRAVADVPGLEAVVWYTTPNVDWASCEMVHGGTEYPVWDTFERLTR